MEENFVAEVLIEVRRKHYNRVRPHSSLGYRPPAPEAVPGQSIAAASKLWVWLKSGTWSSKSCNSFTLKQLQVAVTFLHFLQYC